MTTGSDRPRGADVEIVEPYTERTGGSGPSVDDLPCIKPTVVRVNGVDVGLLAKGGIDVHPGEGPGGDATTVRLTLMPRSVTIKAE